MKPIDKVRSALRRLNLSDNEQAIYLSLLVDGQATARNLSSRTNITRPSVYDQIKNLKKLGLVNELDIDNKAHYAASDLKHLTSLLEDKIDHLEQSLEFIKTALPSLRDSLSTVDPKVRFFHGQDGVKQLLKDIMWYDKSTMQIIWPHKSMQAVFEETFISWFDDRRAKRELVIHSIWPKETTKTDRLLFSALRGDVQKVSRDPLPKMATILYGKKVAYISSSAESFGYIIESQEHHDLQAMHFGMLWKEAKRV